MANKEKKLALIDGSAYFYRAYHALPPLKNSKGQETGAIHGFITAIHKLIADFKPSNIAMIFDPKGPNFRHEIYPDYKANREAMPDELVSQIQLLYKALDYNGLKPIIIEGYEADDVIGTLTKKFKDEIEILIFSGDKDFSQLVDDKVSIINPVTYKPLDHDGIFEKFNVYPKEFIDFLALVGDKSDNIPGVDGIGPKTASSLIRKFGSIENIIKNADKITGKNKEKIKNSQNNINLSKKLAEIKCDVKNSYTLDQLIKKDIQLSELIQLYKKLEFKNLLKDIDRSNEKPDKDNTKITKKKYSIISDEKKLNKLIEEINDKKFISLDLETTSLDYIKAEIVGISISYKVAEAFYIPVMHDDDSIKQISREKVLKKLHKIFESKLIKKIGHNLKYDKNVLFNYGINLQGVSDDTMILSYVYNSGIMRHNLDSLASMYLDYETIKYEELAGKGAKQICFSKVKIQDAAEYACEDADISLRLFNFLIKKIKKDKKLYELYQNVEMKLMPILSEIEQNGVLLDQKKLNKYSRKLNSELQILEKNCFSLSGVEFNINSPKQLQHILYEELNLPVLKKTPSGQPSTDESTLGELAESYELPEKILEYRSLSKLKSTYTDKLPLQISDKTGRVHTSYQQAVTLTGRLSSSDPNLQNIPIKSEQGKKIREAFIAQKDFYLISADYSQIELRVMAHFSNDKNLISSFQENIDIHSSTASEIFDISLDKISEDERRSAKAINFGLIYGMSAFGLSKQLKIPINFAKNYIEKYFSKYPGILDYMNETKKTAHNNKFVSTLYGRKIHLPDIDSKQFQKRNYAERTAINAPIQGTAADIIKIAMISVNEYIKENNLNIKIIMQVHDELVFEVHESINVKSINKIMDIMQNVKGLKVPLIVNYGKGMNWGVAH